MIRDDRFKRQIPESDFTKFMKNNRQAGTVWQLSAGKPPKLRFKPGQFFQMDDGKLYEIMYCFRCKDEPNVWLVCLEERKSLNPSAELDKIGNILVAGGCGENTPRIVYELFVSSFEAMSYFSDIPSSGSRWTVSTQTILNKGKLVSSGELIK